MPKANDLPMDADQHLDRALDLVEQEEWEKALAACDAAIALGGANLADAHNLRGIALEELGRTEEALAAYGMAVQLDPTFTEAAENLMILESELGLHRLATIGVYSQPLEAYVLRGVLEAEGIWSVVANDNLVTANWLFSNALGGVQLQVHAQDADRARDLLAASVADDSVDADEEEALVCPRCDSPAIHYEKYSTKAVFVSWLLLGAPLPFFKREWSCESCGNTWKD